MSTASSGTAAGSSNPNLPATPPADGANVAGAQKYVLAQLGVPKFVPPGPAFNMRSVKKPVWLLETQPDAEPAPHVTEGFIQGAQASGAPYHVCLANGTPEGNALCLQQAAQAGAGSAVVWSVPLNEIAGPLAQARAAGVKVVSGNSAFRIGEPVPSAVSAEVSIDYPNAGELNGGYAVAARGGSLDALCVNVPDFVTGTSVCQGFTSVVHQFCSACKVRTTSIPSATALTQIGPVVSQAVLADPKLNYIMAAYDYLDPGINVQLKALGKSRDQVMVAGENGSVPSLAALQEAGSNQVADAGQNPFWWGWSFFDAGARAEVGAIGNTAVLGAPNQLFTRESFTYKGALTYANSLAVYGLGDGSVFKKGYEALWHGQ